MLLGHETAKLTDITTRGARRAFASESAVTPPFRGMMKSNRKAGKKAPFPVRERDFCHAKPKRALRASWNGTYNAELLKFAEKLMAHTQGPVETKFGNKSLRFFSP